MKVTERQSTKYLNVLQVFVWWSGGKGQILCLSGIQSPDQQSLLAKHNPNKPVFVEGPFPLWLRRTCVYYYVLKADPVPPEEKVGKF